MSHFIEPISFGASGNTNFYEVDTFYGINRDAPPFEATVTKFKIHKRYPRRLKKCMKSFGIVTTSPAVLARRALTACGDGPGIDTWRTGRT